MGTLLCLCRKAWFYRSRRRDFLIFAIFSFSAVFSSGLKAADIDSLSLRALDSRIKEYVSAMEVEPAGVKMAESDFLISSCNSEEVRNHVVSKLYSHFLNSKLMGDDAVAVHIVDKWLLTGKAKLPGAVEMMNARIFADFNRSSLIGRRAPSLRLENTLGEKVEILGLSPEADSLAGVSERLRVLYFYSPDCPKCKLESYKLNKFLESCVYDLEVFLIYTGDDFKKWESFFSNKSFEPSSSVRLFDFWDPEIESGFQRKYGVLQTPSMFLINKQGFIIGRGLDTEALEKLLNKEFEKYTYGSEESLLLFDKIFSSINKTSASDVIGVASYIDSKLGSLGKDELFKRMTGDYLYYLAGKKGEAYKIGTKYVIDSLILSRPSIWNKAEDTLEVVGMAQVMGQMLSRADVGSLVPDVRAYGVLKNYKRDRRGVWDLRKLRRDTYVVFYTEGCNACDAELEGAESFFEALRSYDKKSSLKKAHSKSRRHLRKTFVLLINMDEIISKDRGMAFNLLDSFDLLSLPYITFIDRKGIVRRKYMSFLND